MFNTSIHWTTFFYLLIDTAIVLFAFYLSKKAKENTLNRFLNLGFLFIVYNYTGGFLPIESFPVPFILQYIITYGVAFTLCIYIIYYLYKEYDIVILKYNSTIRNLSILALTSFIVLFLVPYYLTESLDLSRILFTIPISALAFIFLFFIYKRTYNPKNPNPFIFRRNKLSLVSLISIALLPICTLIGDYQWLTFTVMNIAFYAITWIEVDRYLYFLKNQKKMFEVFSFYQGQKEKVIESKILYGDLTRREIEVSVSILGKMSYKQIGENLFIAESTVSKHASNIFKKMGVKNRKEFIKKFGFQKSNH